MSFSGFYEPLRPPRHLIDPRVQNITLSNAELRYCDGDAMVVRNSNMINIDAGEYEE